MTKAALRTQFLTERKALPTEILRQASEAISGQLIDRIVEQLTLIPSLTLHTFLPIARQREIDTWPLICQLWRDFPSVRIVASVTEPDNQRLRHYELTSDTVLTNNRWGIPEPVFVHRYVGADAIDWVLVPLLLFDRRGHRVGYGGGYYDRFLAECRPDCQKIGLSVFDPIDQIDPIEPTDVALNSCVTPRHIYTFMF